MSPRAWIVLLLVLAAVGWWFSPLSPRVPDAPPVVQAPGAIGVPCPLPPRVVPGGAPLQSPVPAAFAPLDVAGARLQPLAGFSIDARVLSRRDYGFGREADFSPTDLALG